MPADQPITLTRVELNALIEDASERGAQKALKSVGLGDEKAVHDIREIRSLVEAWRVVKVMTLQTVAKVVTTGVLIAIAAYYFAKH